MSARVNIFRRPIIRGIKLGAFAELNGSSHYFTATDAAFPAAGITGANDFTIQAFVNLSSDSLETILAKYETTGDKRMFFFWIASAGMHLIVSEDGLTGAPQGTSNSVIVLNSWQHVAVVYDASAGTADFYRNGAFVNQASGLDNSIADKDPDLEVGSLLFQSAFYSGGLLNVALFDDMRTAGEIATSAANREEDLSGAGNIIGQWLFNDAAAATAIDNNEGTAGGDLVLNGGDTTNYGTHTRKVAPVP